MIGLRRITAPWSAVCRGFLGALGSLLEFVYPECCVLCGALYGERPWCPEGPRLDSILWCDRPHLCWECGRQLVPAVVSGTLPVSGVPVYGGRRTGPELVAVLGQWKYHGVRGLAWPLAQLVNEAVGQAMVAAGPVDILVPVALHSRRQRARGFNQAAILAGLAGLEHQIELRTDLLQRRRATGQQAKLSGETQRQANMAGAFEVTPVLEGASGLRVGLVDDLVTGGSTCDAACLVLRNAGWDVRWVVALGSALVQDNLDAEPSVDMIAGEF